MKLEELQRDEESHKGQNGRVGVIAGSRDYSGAPALAAKAAMRTGADLAKILTSEEVADTVASYSENFIVWEHAGGYFGEKAVDRAFELDEWADVIVVGPGLSDIDTIALQEFLENAESELVIDADAIEPAAEKGIEGLYTPHGGELEDILQFYSSEQGFVEETGSTLLVKGTVDRVISDSGEEEVKAGCAAMTVGGTGDVLSGVVASLMAQGIEREKAAELGARINGGAGEKAAEEYGNGLLATDLIEKLPAAIQKL